MENQSPEGLRRRNVVAGIAVAGVGAPLLAACADKVSSAPTAKSGEVLAKTADVPVGGGVVLKDANVVITQPTAGAFNCFTATCTHQGCLVGGVSNGAIVCPCHGSQFSITDGANVVGPSGQAAGSVAPLAREQITVKGDEIVLGAGQAASGPTASSTAKAAGAALTSAAAVPVGGGVVVTSANVVVTQPTKGSFKCFTAVCTHQGCQLEGVSNGAIVCPCHGSQFSIKDGHNVVGPNGQPAGSVAPLAETQVVVQNGEVHLA